MQEQFDLGFGIADRVSVKLMVDDQKNGRVRGGKQQSQLQPRQGGHGSSRWRVDGVLKGSGGATQNLIGRGAAPWPGCGR